MGKGDTRRKSQVPEEKVQSNWDRIFKKREEKVENQFLKEHKGQIQQEYNCYCNSINKIRHDLGLDSKVFTQNDFDRFSYAFIKRRLK